MSLVLIFLSFPLSQGEGGRAREHKTSFHAIKNVIKNEGISGLYVG